MDQCVGSLSQAAKLQDMLASNSVGVFLTGQDVSVASRQMTALYMGCRQLGSAQR